MTLAVPRVLTLGPAEGVWEQPGLGVPAVATATADKTNTGLFVDTGPDEKLPDAFQAPALPSARRGWAGAALGSVTPHVFFLISCLVFRAPALTF